MADPKADTPAADAPAASATAQETKSKPSATPSDVQDAIKALEQRAAQVPHSESVPVPSADDLKELADLADKAAKAARAAAKDA